MSFSRLCAASCNDATALVSRRSQQKSRPVGGLLSQTAVRLRPCWLTADSLRLRAKVGGARRDRTADLVNAIHALSHLSYGPNSQGSVSVAVMQTRAARRRIQVSSSFSMLSPMMSVTSGSPSSSSSMKAASSRLSSISTSSSSPARPRLPPPPASCPAARRRRLPARRIRRPPSPAPPPRLRRPAPAARPARRRRLGPRARRRRRDRHDLAGIGRDHRRLVEVVEFAAGVGADALGAEIELSPRSGSSEKVAKSVLHLASRAAPVNSGKRGRCTAPARGMTRPRGRVVGRRCSFKDSAREHRRFDAADRPPRRPACRAASGCRGTSRSRTAP